MIKVKKQTIRKKEVERLFNFFKKEDLLKDRSEYDKEDLKDTYPHLNEKEIKLLYLKLQKWKYSKVKGKRKNSFEE
jgi:hypothetical protein